LGNIYLYNDIIDFLKSKEVASFEEWEQRLK